MTQPTITPAAALARFQAEGEFTCGEYRIVSDNPPFGPLEIAALGPRDEYYPSGHRGTPVTEATTWVRG